MPVSQAHHGPMPMFGMAVGAMIPFTSCWIILYQEITTQNNIFKHVDKSHSWLLWYNYRRVNCAHILTFLGTEICYYILIIM